jgi:hypothetical protein
MRVIKSNRMRWAEHVAHMRELRNAYNILVGKHEGRRPLGRSRCKWILGKCGVKVWTGFVWFRTGSSGRLL